MSITPVPELERLLDGDTYFERYYIDTPTLRALVNVAKATKEQADAYRIGFSDDCVWDSVSAALATLFPNEESGVVQDAQQCPTCNGHGGGGGFDRNGSHNADEYREYPCPKCGKEADDE